jgi:hypothetical protein
MKKPTLVTLARLTRRGKMKWIEIENTDTRYRLRGKWKDYELVVALTGIGRISGELFYKITERTKKEPIYTYSPAETLPLHQLFIEAVRKTKVADK